MANLQFDYRSTVMTVAMAPFSKLSEGVNVRKLEKESNTSMKPVRPRTASSGTETSRGVTWYECEPMMAVEKRKESTGIAAAVDKTAAMTKATKFFLNCMMIGKCKR